MMADKVDPAQKLYTTMRLWEFPDQYLVDPTDGSSSSILAVSRLDGSMNLIDEIPQCNTVRVPKIQTIYGVVGMLKLLAGSYLLVITGRECVGSYLGHSIFKVTSLKVFPCDHSLKNFPEEQKKMESEFSRLLKVAERTPGLYFSYDVNMTLSAQRLNDLGDESKLLPLWRQADPRFLWNNYMLEVLIDNKLDPYLLPVIQGSFQNIQAAIGKEILDVALIARRCTRRTGTRMWRRGADSDGFVANFVETEQIIQIHGHTASFIQVRGSMPFLWDQIVDLTYKPNFEIVKPEEAPRVAERHFLDLRKKYGNVLAVDLVNKHGNEGRLSEKFCQAVEPIVSDDVRYLHFDFHKICGHVHFERLSILYEQIEDFLIKSRYFLLNEKGEKVETQGGVVRTNCIDCLDRTNVTQSTIARKMLEFQLRRLGIFEAEEIISSHPNFDNSFKILWANHGDEVSIQYSGTPALKGDFVRCGQRTIQGILNDGKNALMRYYLNNFADGTKQDASDLIQGHYIVSLSRSMTPTAKKGGIEAVASFPLALGVILIGFFFALLSLRRARHDLWSLLFSFMWASMSLAIAVFVRSNGRTFCNRPRLHQPRR
ncbi:phosphoinositide phosphatase SAC6-like isoform X2 [Salvia splendens]|uniref:phosphoinositide phosphatase SAC6-like isoform X2 n=1 Tax=Salvia splendens TaxID=180675 RepID=UPI001C25C773|nr:phosphoinositide phosphatase SAC6-like isoform X2 [Salvia splendens]